MLLKKHAVNFAFLLSVLALYSCGVRPVGSSTPIASNIVPNKSLQVNTYPPMQNNGSAMRFVHYGIEDGLSQSSAQAILQDDLGFLWIGTQDGLNRFDGYSFKVFRPNPNDPYSLSDRDITSIIQGSGGTIWVGTSSGLDRYDSVTGRFSRFLHDDRNPDSLVDGAVQAICQDRQGTVWVGTAHGLDGFDPASGKFTHVMLPKNQSTNTSIYSVSALYEDVNGLLWIGTSDGLFGFDTENKNFKIYQTNGDKPGITFDEISSIVGDANNILWVGTTHGLIRLYPSTRQAVIYNHSVSDTTTLSDDAVQATYIDHAGELWVGTRSGLDRFDPRTQQFIHYQNDPVDPTSLSNNAVDSIYEDRGGVLWVGTLDGGLDKHDHGQDEFAYYHHINADPLSLSGDVVFPITPAPDGKVWVGSYQDGLNLFDPATGQSQHFRHDPSNPDSLQSDAVISLFRDKQGTLWIGTRQGMDRLNAGSPKFIHYIHDPTNASSIPMGAIFTIFQDSQSAYWVGTSFGVRIFDPLTGQFKKLNLTDSNAADLADGRARVVYQDRGGTIWIGTDSHGLFSFNPVTKELEQYKNLPDSPNSFTNAGVMDVYEDSRGMIWVATFGGGLNRYLSDRDTFVPLVENNGLPSNVVYGILEDATGNLWLSTDFGLSKFDPLTSSFENFTIDDGLQSNEFDSSAFAASDGKMYFGGIKGLTVFDPANIKKNEYIPPVVLTSLTTLDGNSVDSSQTAETLQEITLPYLQNSFDFSFASLSFSQTNKNQYQYKLEGFDKDWHSAGTEHHGSYTNLPGGTFILHIRGSSSDGAWNDAGASIKITVIAPVWQTWPFRGLMAAALFILITLGYRWRLHGVNAQKTELENIVQDRTLALKKQNLDLEALYWADDKMLRVFTVDQVMQTLADVAVDILQTNKSAVFTQAGVHGEYSARVSRGFQAEVVESLHFVEDDEIVALASQGRSFVVNDVVNDSKWKRQRPEVIEKMRVENVQSLMFMPIKVQNTILGIFNVCSSRPDEFDEDRQGLFAFLVQRAALSIENSHLVEQTKQMAIMEERNRLARDLHDSAKQKAFAALAQLGTAKRLTNNGGDAGNHLNEAENILSDVIRDLTFLIQELYPKELKEKGLVASLRNYALEWEGRTGIRLDLSAIGERALSFELEQILYRVVLEGLSNIARHSQATRADIQVVYQERAIELQISDNGHGFDIQSTSGGLGLRLIREQIEGIGGKANVQSQPGGGTRLVIRVPLDVKE